MKEHPELTFTAATSQFYVWIEENDPEMLEEIRQRVEEGRWSLAGGWWMEADATMSGGESLMRQGLYGQHTLRRLFGHFTTVGYNPDAPGHPASIPQILKHQGMNAFVFTRPQTHEMKLPVGFFRWEGIDGTRVLAYRPPQNDFVIQHSLDDRIRRILTKTKPTTQDILLLFGVGDHGGGPTKAIIRDLIEIQNQTDGPFLQYNTPENFLASLPKQAVSELPLIRGGLLHHAIGGYTNVSEMKKNSRTAEATLVTAEKIASIGSLVWGCRYPGDDLRSAWKRALYQHVHDSINGVSLRSHYETTGKDAFGYALDISRRTLYKAAQKLAWDVPTVDPNSQYLFVFNPHAWEIKIPVHYQFFNWPNNTTVRVEDEQGDELPYQWISTTVHFSPWIHNLATQVTVPALGYRQIRVRPVKEPVNQEPKVFASDTSLENEYLRVEFGKSGAIGILDKRTDQQVFQGGIAGARPVIIDDPYESWANGKVFDQEIASFDNASIRVLDNGPLFSSIRVRSTYGASTLTMDWILYAGSPKLEARVTLGWREQQKMLKFSFPVDVTKSKATWEIPYGHVSRLSKGGEEPGHRWIDVTGQREEDTYGLAVINDAKYGYSVLDNDLRVSVVRSPLYGHRSRQEVDPNKDYHWQNQGTQTFRMVLVPHIGAWQDAGIVRTAEELCAPLPIILQGIHPGSRPQADSLIELNNPNAVISAIKQAESGDDLIVRCYETNGRNTEATIDFRFVDKKWTGSFHPLEIKTLRMNAKTGAIREVNALEE